MTPAVPQGREALLKHWFYRLRSTTPLGKLSEADGLMVVAGLIKIGGEVGGLTFRDDGSGAERDVAAAAAKLSRQDAAGVPSLDARRA